MLLTILQIIQRFLNENVGVVTFLVGFLAIYLYLKQKKDRKRDAAKLILQEIRYAEQQIRKYHAFGKYKLYDKLLPTNSWNDNIHLFVKDLKETEIDTISNFYSKASYIDVVIEKISNQKNTLPSPTIQPHNVSQPPTTGGFEAPQPLLQEIEISLAVSPMSQKILEDASKSVEFIYNTPVVDRLKNISEREWYQLI